MHRRSYCEEYWNSEFAEQYDQLSLKEYSEKIENIRYFLCNVNLHDYILDFGCGNGLITKTCSELCKGIIGLDISEPLIASAKKDSPGNCFFYCGNIFDMKDIIGSNHFSKIISYSTLQYISPRNFSYLIDILIQHLEPTGDIWLFNIPDYDKLSVYLENPLKRFCVKSLLWMNYCCVFCNGYWYKKALIIDKCKLLGLKYEFRDSTYYRFDVRIHR